jgi:hypothetical protein
LARFEDFADDSLPTTATNRVNFPFDAINCLHTNGIFLRVLEEEGRIPDRKIVSENGHRSEEIILEMVQLRKHSNSEKTRQLWI